MTITDYQTCFLGLANRCKGLSESHQINIFTAGLRDPLNTNVELEQPATLEEAMPLARAYEQRLSMTLDPPTRPGSRPAYGRTKQMALLALPPAMGGQTGAPITTATELRFKRLTVAEMAAKHAWGKC
jgi:hypothetical protein